MKSKDKKIQALNDPFALEVEWTALEYSGIPFRDKDLVRLSSSVLAYKSNSMQLIFLVFFLVIGLSPILTLLYYSKKWPSELNALIPFFFILFAIVISFSRNMKKTIEFDNAKRLVTIGKREIKLDEIHAVQLITELSGNMKNTYSYELILVLKNKERILLSQHTKFDAIKSDSRTMSSHLGLPLWDIVENEERNLIFS